jgi:hypothetical protein
MRVSAWRCTRSPASRDRTNPWARSTSQAAAEPTYPNGGPSGCWTSAPPMLSLSLENTSGESGHAASAARDEPSGHGQANEECHTHEYRDRHRGGARRDKSDDGLGDGAPSSTGSPSGSRNQTLPVAPGIPAPPFH